MFKRLSVLFLPIFFLSCGDKEAPQEPESEIHAAALGTAKVRVQASDGSPIANADILFGTALGDPFANNFLSTNDHGEIDLPSDWVDGLPVTIDAPGYIRTTFFHQIPMGQTYVLNRFEEHQRLEVKGKTTGFGKLRKDGYLDVGLVLPALSKYDLLNFDISMVLSPMMDKISIVGKEFELPSNITLPRQKENYILPITFNKPKFRTVVRSPGVHRFYASHVKFHLKRVVNAVRNDKPLFEVINEFQFLKGSVRDLNVTASTQQHNLPVNDLSFPTKKTIQAPVIQGEQVMVSLALAKNSHRMIPTDIKRLASREKQTLSFSNSMEKSLLHVLTHKEAFNRNFSMEKRQRFSAVIQSWDQGGTPAFLPLISKPTRAQTDLLVAPPTNSAGLYAYATYSAISDIEHFFVNGLKSEIKTRVWEFYAPGWAKEIKAPQFPKSLRKSSPTPNQSATQQRWEVSFLGSQTQVSEPIGPQSLMNATHVTHHAVDY